MKRIKIHNNNRQAAFFHYAWKVLIMWLFNSVSGSLKIAETAIGKKLAYYATLSINFIDKMLK